MAKDFVHDADKRLSGVDDDAAAGDVVFRSMRARKKFLFLWFSAPVGWVARHALIKPPIQCVKVIDIKNTNAVE